MKIIQKWLIELFQSILAILASFQKPSGVVASVRITIERVINGSSIEINLPGRKSMCSHTLFALPAFLAIR